jgi:hypothetical protein
MTRKCGVGGRVVRKEVLVTRNQYSFGERGEVRGKDRGGLDLEVDGRVSKFRVLSKESFDDYNMHLYLMKHEELGVHWFHFDSNDLDNSFTLLFRTLPDDNSGKPHILEHTGNTESPLILVPCHGVK